MRDLALAFLILILASLPANGQDHERRARELDAHSKRLLGVDVTTLQWLLQVREGQYLLKSALDQSGDFARIQMLQDKGLIKFQVVKGLPDGHEPKNEFVRITPTSQGREIIRALRQ